MRTRDSVLGMQDAKPYAEGTNPESRILDPVTLERVRWRCRRGLLELDIVLGRFIEQRYAFLDKEQCDDFDELLDLPDTELWDLITGKKEPTHTHQRVVLEWLQQA